MKINKKILIAEDELLIAKVLRIQLEKLGFVVQNISSAEQIFDMVKLMQPDIIILDVCLKNKTCGLAAGRKLREVGIITPIIFTTGNSYINTFQQTVDIEYSRVLIKPVEFEQLLVLINEL
jgi:DNA-binding response OmpR family regulator